MTEITLDTTQTLLVAILAYFMGRWLTAQVAILDRFRIPEAVTGGLVVAIGIAILHQWPSVSVSFTAGDLMLLAFFSTIGLNARLTDMRAGGRALAIVFGLAAGAVVLQSMIGLSFASVFGAPPAAGMMAGSVALVGGHGTAAAWAPLFEQSAALAGTIGLASATFGLVAGGLVGGPLGRYLIIRNGLEPAEPEATDLVLSDREEGQGKIDVPQFLASVLVIAFAIGVGEQLNALVLYLGANLPHFVTALFAGILIGNLGPAIAPGINWPMRSPALRLIAELSLSIFLVRALMSLKLWTLMSVAGPLLVVLLSQVASMLLIGYFVLFRALGRDYDAAIITSGFVGLTLGATPTAVANMSALTHKFGPSMKAFLVIPLMGAFFIDLVNAFVISSIYSLING